MVTGMKNRALLYLTKQLVLSDALVAEGEQVRLLRTEEHGQETRGDREVLQWLRDQVKEKL